MTVTDREWSHAANSLKCTRHVPSTCDGTGTECSTPYAGYAGQSLDLSDLSEDALFALHLDALAIDHAHPRYNTTHWLLRATRTELGTRRNRRIF